MVEGLDEALVGLSAGESATFRSQLMGGDLAGKDVDIQVSVQAVKEQELPDLDDEFAQTASEFDSVDELRADLRERLTRAKRLEQASAARDAVLETLLERVEVPLPDGVVAEELQGRRQQITQQLAYAGMTQEQYLETEGQTAEEFEADLDRRVRDAITAQFVLDEIATKEQMGVSEAELTEHLVRRAQQAGVSPDEYAKHAMEHDHISALVSEVVRAKALAHVVEHAAVTDESGNAVELSRLQPDGTYADAATEGATDEPADETADAASEAEDAPEPAKA
jgi:trigger factor